LKKFYDLEKQIACQILEDLDRNCDNAPEAFHRTHTKDYEALVFFAAGLDFFDAEQYSDARESFQKALARDPNFELAQTALLDTPVPSMQFMSESGEVASEIGTNEQMITMAAAHGVSADATTDAAVAGQTGGVGVGATLGMIGGSVLVTGAVAGIAAAGSGGDSSSSHHDNDNQPTDVTDAEEADFLGTYDVIAQDVTFDQWHGQITFYSGGTGSYIETIQGEPYSGSLTWSFNASTTILAFTTDGGAQFSGTASGNTDNFILSGTWSNGSSGTIEFTRQ
jgi:hypothetical protein